MTVVNINLKNIGSGTNPIDKVIFYSPVYRDGATSGEMVSTAEQHVYLVQGVGVANLTPGPVSVRFAVRGIVDTIPKEGIVPNDGPVTLNEVIENSFTYTPPVVSEVITLRDEVRDIHDAVEQSRDEIVEAAVRIGTAEQVNLWAQQAGEAADRAENAMVNKADLVNGKVPSNQIPAVALTKPFSVSSRAAMLALNAQEGDVAVITAGTDKGTYMLGSGSPTSFSSWIFMAVTSNAPVQSVNGQTGTVNLGYGDVGAAPATHKHIPADDITGWRPYSTTITDAGTVPWRDSAGHIGVPNNPTNDSQAANRKFVMDNINNAFNHINTRTPNVRVVSSMPTSPVSGYVYVVTG